MSVICVAVSRIDRNPRLARQWPGSTRVEPGSGPYLVADPGAADGTNAPRGHAGNGIATERLCKSRGIARVLALAS